MTGLHNCGSWLSKSKICTQKGTIPERQDTTAWAKAVVCRWNSFSLRQCLGPHEERWGSGPSTPKYGTPWHIEYFKLKKFEKTTETAQSLWLSPTAFPWNLLVRCAPPIPRVKENPYLHRHWEESEQTGLAKFTSVYYIISDSLTCHISITMDSIANLP